MKNIFIHPLKEIIENSNFEYNYYIYVLISKDNLHHYVGLTKDVELTYTEPLIVHRILKENPLRTGKTMKERHQQIGPAGSRHGRITCGQITLSGSSGTIHAGGASYNR